MTKKKRTIFSFVPDKDIKSLVRKGITKVARQRMKSGVPKREARKGVKSKIINDALRLYLADLRGKREGNVA